MKTMTAKYPGTCVECGQAIKRGDQINFFGRGRAAHACNAEQCKGDVRTGTSTILNAHRFSEDEEYTGVSKSVREDDYRAESSFGLERGTLANDRRLAHNGLSVTRFASGATMTQNSRGRCEDAPCCGCCS